MSGGPTPQRTPTNTRTHHTFRLDEHLVEVARKGMKRSYFGNTAAFVEAAFKQYAEAYEYAIQSMPIWKSALTSAPKEIREASELYPPFLHYQFSSAKSHTSQDQGYYIRIRHFSSGDTAMVEVCSSDPKVVVMPLVELTPIYCCRDIFNELSR